MTLKALYEGVNLQDYYLGKVTQVYRSCCVAQIDNLAAMYNRKKYNDSFRPNTISNFVIIESTGGLFLGEIFENKASKENLFEMKSVEEEKPCDFHRYDRHHDTGSQEVPACRL